MKNPGEESRAELTLSRSVKLLAECVGDVVPECVENVRLAILRWETSSEADGLSGRMIQMCHNCTKKVKINK